MSIGAGYTTEHSLGLFYSQSTAPLLQLTSLEEMCVMEGVLPCIGDPGDLDTRIWRSAGPGCGQRSPFIASKADHSVGGSFYIPHAETCTILLLQSSAYSEEHELDASRWQGRDGSRGWAAGAGTGGRNVDGAEEYLGA